MPVTYDWCYNIWIFLCDLKAENWKKQKQKMCRLKSKHQLSTLIWFNLCSVFRWLTFASWIGKHDVDVRMQLVFWKLLYGWQTLTYRCMDACWVKSQTWSLSIVTVNLTEHIYDTLNKKQKEWNTNNKTICRRGNIISMQNT